MPSQKLSLYLYVERVFLHCTSGFDTSINQSIQIDLLTSGGSALCGRVLHGYHTSILYKRTLTGEGVENREGPLGCALCCVL